MRSLVSVQNGTDFELEVSLAMISVLRKPTTVQESGDSEEIGEIFEEEFFENERYQPIVGWGSKWPGHLLPTDPTRYTARDYSNPLKVQDSSLQQIHLHSALSFSLVLLC
jgi:vacuolar protein sorting-associated protein 13A/C